MCETKNVSVTEYFVEKDSKGNLIIDKKTAKLIEEFKAEVITEECPACDGDGFIVDCRGRSDDFCPTCMGKGKISYSTQLKITPISTYDKMLMDIYNMPKNKKIETAKNNGFLIFNGSDKSWENIPKEIKAISKDSRGITEFYSGVSGIYERYDDELSNNPKVKSQYWYFGTALKNLNITKKHKNLKIIIDSNKNTEIFYRKNSEKIILDFESKKGFNWSIFPDSITKLFVIFGDMNFKDQRIHIYATSDKGYLREDNVCWGRESRNEQEIGLLVSWIDDGTNEYPVENRYLSSNCKYNEMNIHFKNIPLKTIVYELPKDRSKKIPVSELKLLYTNLCGILNKHVRKISNSLTLPRYPFKYQDEKRKEIELWILKTQFVVDYEIFEDLSIGITGRFFIGEESPDEIPYKIRYVNGEMFIHSKKLKSKKNFPDWVNTFSFGWIEGIKNFGLFPKEIRLNKVEIFYGTDLEKISDYPEGIELICWGQNYKEEFINFIKENKLYKQKQKTN
jgi:hypothetical protein